MRRNILALLRTFLFAAFVPAISLSLVACEPESGDDGGGTIPPGVTPEVSVPDGYVNYFIEDLPFSRSAGEVKVAFQINVDWSMEVVAPEGTSASWLSVEPASGAAGLHKVMVRVTDNDTYEARSAKIHLMCGTAKVAEIAVTQDYEYAVLLSRRDYSVSYEATTIDVELKSNVTFRYKIADADWVCASTDATRAWSTHNLSFDVDENDSRKEREAHILFYNSEYAVADTLTLVQEGNPNAKGNTDYTVNGVSFTMVAVEGGTFTMGATSEQGSDAYDDEKPAHQVTLSDYYIGETEVTQELWQAVMGSNPSNFAGNLQRPVECVSWNDCQIFITKLNNLTGENFRLPTEAEWEYAARGGNASEGYKYSGSNSIGDVAWYWDNSTHPVKTKQANELGIYDMSGNVYEWCADWYSSSYYSSSPQDNPTGPSSGSYRVLRGGGWRNFARDCRVAYRDYDFRDYPDGRYYCNGLRLAR